MHFPHQGGPVLDLVLQLADPGLVPENDHDSLADPILLDCADGLVKHVPADLNLISQGAAGGNLLPLRLSLQPEFPVALPRHAPGAADFPVQFLRPPVGEGADSPLIEDQESVLQAADHLVHLFRKGGHLPLRAHQADGLCVRIRVQILVGERSYDLSLLIYSPGFPGYTCGSALRRPR